jgi:predicted CxxxxCH...CXXCH cytochrome family protein
MGYAPEWDAASATCGSTYCHAPSPGDVHASPVWNVEQSLTCTSCHGLPPALPHPQSENCSVCHGDVVASDNRTIIDKSRHVNGTVDVNTDVSCTSCHGSVNPAPPVDIAGLSATTEPGVGAHQTHVLGTERSRAVPCNECHVVPETVLDPGHLDSALPAELTFSGVALANGATPTYTNGTCQATTCHGAVFPNGDPSGGSNTTPTWTRVNGTEAACGACHGIPPPPPHPNPGNPCHNCHADMADDDVTFTHPELHVDGIVTFQLE